MRKQRGSVVSDDPNRTYGREGSVVLTTQGTAVTGSRLYRTYGAKRSGVESAFERTDTGQHLDDTELLYYGARHYDPAAGRILSF